jgi:protein SCO1
MNRYKTPHNKRKLKILFYLILVFLSISILSFFSGCSKSFSKDEKINSSFKLVNQDSSKVTFPNDFNDKVIVMGFIYTNCPDICPLTVHNMQLIQEKLKKEENHKVDFVALSFDPERDKPYILKQYAAVRGINLSNFEFLTGKKWAIDSLLDIMNVFAFPDDTTKGPGGENFYYITHTDRITLIDKDGNIREDYSGSHADLDKLLNDIKTLL